VSDLLVLVGAGVGICGLAGAIVAWFEPRAQWVQFRPPRSTAVTIQADGQRAITYDGGSHE